MRNVFKYNILTRFRVLARITDNANIVLVAVSIEYIINSLSGKMGVTIILFRVNKVFTFYHIIGCNGFQVYVPQNIGGTQNIGFTSVRDQNFNF